MCIRAYRFSPCADGDCASGGIGRRTGLRIQRFIHTGSSPVSRTRICKDVPGMAVGRLCFEGCCAGSLPCPAQRGSQSSSIPPRQRAGSSPPWPCCCMFLPRPACGEPAKGYPPSILLAVASRAIPHQTAALFLHLFLPVPERLLLPSSPFRQRTAFHLDRHASVLIFDGRELPGDRRPAA